MPEPRESTRNLQCFIPPAFIADYGIEATMLAGAAISAR